MSDEKFDNMKHGTERRFSEDHPKVIQMDLAEKDIETAVFECIGAASVCWENMSGTGVFLDSTAKEIGDQLLARIHLELVDPSPVIQNFNYASAPADMYELRRWAFEQANRMQLEAKVEDAATIEEYVLNGVKKEDPDLHDQDSLDQFYAILTEKIQTQEDWMATMSVEVDAFVTDLQNALTNAGVRFKKGKTFEELLE